MSGRLFGVLAEFVGGPWDGELQSRSSAQPTLYVQLPPRIGWLSEEPMVPMWASVYRRAEKRPSPGGGFCFRYRWEGDPS